MIITAKEYKFNFSELLTSIHVAYNYNVNKSPHFFKTSVDVYKIWDEYLSIFKSSEERQQYDCSVCKSFVKKYGNLAFVDNDGIVKSVFWEDFENINNLFDNAKITDVFIDNKPVWGTLEAGGWQHFYIINQCKNR